MPAEQERNQRFWLAGASAGGLVLLGLYVLSWGPVGALAEHWRLECKPLEIAYSPIDWIVDNCPGAYGPLASYWKQFDFLRQDCGSRPSKLINTSDSLSNIPAIWERAWFIDGPRKPGFRKIWDTPYRKTGGAI